MKVLARLAALALAATATTLVVASGPASAAVTTSTLFNTLIVDITGPATITFSCVGGSTAINDAVPSPTLPCSTIQKVQVNGDGDAQNVYGNTLGDEFAAHPYLSTNLGAGNDYVIESPQADVILTGDGADTIQLMPPGAVNTTINAGNDSDYVYAYGSDNADTFTLSASGSTSTLATTISGTSLSYAISNVENYVIRSNGGNDTITSTGVPVASIVDYVELDGGPGDDTITDGPITAALFGRSGTNTLTGGAGPDAFWTESSTDTVNGSNDTDPDWIYDGFGLLSGGRAISGFTGLDTYVDQTHQGDVTMRVRPTSGGVLLTTSLSRPGQQVVPTPVKVGLGQSYSGAIAHRGIADVVLTSSPVNVTMLNTGGGILDVTVPTGTWDTFASGSSVSVSATAGSLTSNYATDYRVHGPWTNKNQGFAHRVTRDLMFRFATDAQRDAIRDQLTAGTKTRAQITASLMNTDEYRGLDVDRVYVKYLRRTSDPGGRTSWIRAIRNGKALWRFRAQLFGSNEYFTKAGATNAAYVEKAYNDVLGRSPDPSGKAHWTTKLNNGADRGSVALQFMNSPEARRRLVDDQFLRFLDRLPTSTEQSTWVARIPTASGEQDLIAFLANSNAYFNRT